MARPSQVYTPQSPLSYKQQRLWVILIMKAHWLRPEDWNTSVPGLPALTQFRISRLYESIFGDNNFQNMGSRWMGKIVSSSGYSPGKRVTNEHLCSVGPEDTARQFYTLSTEGIGIGTGWPVSVNGRCSVHLVEEMNGVCGISRDLEANLKAEILKQNKTIHSKVKKGQTEINKWFVKCLQNVIICQIHPGLNLEFMKYWLYSTNC